MTSLNREASNEGDELEKTRTETDVTCAAGKLPSTALPNVIWTCLRASETLFANQSVATS